MNKPKTKKQPKPKKCKVCTFNFIPRSTTQKVCSPECAIGLNKINKNKEFYAETRRRKQDLKGRKEFTAEAQTSINCYVRERDYLLPCISCGNFHTGRYDAGHYLSCGAYPELRFNLWNIHKQCHWNCNINRSGNVVAYRINLKNKIGKQKLRWLEGEHSPAKYSIDDLKRIKKIFDLKTKRLKKRRSEQDGY